MARPSQIAEKAAIMVQKALDKKGYVNGCNMDVEDLKPGQSRIQYSVTVEVAMTTLSSYITTTIETESRDLEGNYSWVRSVDSHKTRVSDHAAKYQADLYFRNTNTASEISKAIIAAIL